MSPRKPNARGAAGRPLRPEVVSLLRASVLAAAAAVFCWQLTVASGIVFAALGGLAGALLGDLARRQPLRTASALALAALAFLLGLWAARSLVGSALLARAVGPVPALWIGEAALWLAAVAPVVFALRLLAARRPTLAVLEVLVVGGALVLVLAAHREGMVHRPLLIGDWAWSRGLDPALVLLGLGGLLTLLLAALLVSEDRRRRLPLHFAGLVAIALALFLVVRVTGLPKPDAGDLGLTGDPAEGQQDESDEQDQEGGGGQGQDSSQLEDLQFKNEYNQSGEQAPVAVVLLHDDYSPPVGVYYFRQSAFSQYNGRRLVQSTRDDVDRDLVPRFPTRPMSVPEVPPSSSDRMPLTTTTALLVDHVRPFALDSPVALRPIRNPDPTRFQRAFETVSNVQTLTYDEMIGRRPGRPDWDDDAWRYYTEAPSDPRYRELAERTVALLKPEYVNDPLARALAIKAYLDENGIYSRRSQHADAGDPTASFLFGDLTGYCVHFAHAAVYLMRSLGLPARVAAGYAIDEASRGSGSSLLVRGADAHAWPELYLEDVGWVVVDLAPQQALDEPAGPPDQRLQSMLGEMLRQQFTDPELAAAAGRFDWDALKRRLLLGLLLLLAAAYAVKFYRVLAPYVARPLARYRLAYRAALDRLAEVGVQRRFGESRERFAERSADLAPSFVDLTREHLRWALGSAVRADAASFTRLMAGVERDLGRSVPAWRRLLGWLHPFSWLFTR